MTGVAIAVATSIVMLTVIAVLISSVIVVAIAAAIAIQSQSQSRHVCVLHAFALSVATCAACSERCAVDVAGVRYILEQPGTSLCRHLV